MGLDELVAQTVTETGVILQSGGDQERPGLPELVELPDERPADLQVVVALLLAVAAAVLGLPVGVVIENPATGATDGSSVGLEKKPRLTPKATERTDSQSLGPS